MSLGQLWLEMLRFYTLEFALEEHIISIRLRELLSREGKNWPRRRLAIEGEGGDHVANCLILLNLPGEGGGYTSSLTFRLSSIDVTIHFLPLSFLSPDPFALKRNVARSLNSQMVFEYIQERFRTAYKYFACPQGRATGGCHSARKTSKLHPNKDEEEGKEEPSAKARESGEIGRASCRERVSSPV